MTFVKLTCPESQEVLLIHSDNITATEIEHEDGVANFVKYECELDSQIHVQEISVKSKRLLYAANVAIFSVLIPNTPADIPKQ